MLAKHGYICSLRVIVVIIGLTISAAANAQVIVLQSTVSAYVAGSKIEISAKVNVPEGKTIVVVLPSGITRTINGPFSAPADRLAKSGGSFNISLFKAVENYLRTGGTTSSNVAALRSAIPSHRTVVLPFSWNTLYLPISSDVCLDKNSPTTIVRPLFSTAKVFTIIDLATAERAKVVFTADTNSQPWPATIKLNNGSYGILTKGNQMRTVRLRLIEIPKEENTLQILHDQRCTQQLKAYLHDLRTRTVQPAQTE